MIRSGQWLKQCPILLHEKTVVAGCRGPLETAPGSSDTVIKNSAAATVVVPADVMVVCEDDAVTIHYVRALS